METPIDHNKVNRIQFETLKAMKAFDIEVCPEMVIALISIAVSTSYKANAPAEWVIMVTAKICALMTTAEGEGRTMTIKEMSEIFKPN